MAETESDTGPIVLYVDDEKGNRVVFKHTFSKLFPLKTVESPSEALAAIQNEHVGVIVTDQRMPEMTGNQLLEKVRVSNPGIIRMVVTAYSDLDPILAAVHDGLVARYIVKPWNKKDLAKALNWGMEAYRVGRENSTLQQRLVENERLATIGSVAAGIFHDVRQPLTFLYNDIQRLDDFVQAMPALLGLLERHGSSLSEDDLRSLTDLTGELPELVTEMEHGFKVVLALTDSIKAIAAGRRDANPVSDPNSVITYVVSVCGREGRSSGSAVVYRGPDKLPSVKLSWPELAQTLINLVNNAVQAGKGHAVHVTVDATVNADAVRFSVADDGPGMSESVLATVARPFFSTKKDGLGLGLAQCRKLVEGSGGTFEVKSELGKGTTVLLTVPIASEPAPA